MNDNKYLLKMICEKLGTEASLVLASIVSIEGSSPRHGGAKMIVDERGKSYGTIGGGAMEATVIREASNALSTKQSCLMRFDLTGEDASAKDMICGGTALVLLDVVEATSENIAFFRGFQEAVQADNNGCFYTLFRGADQAVDILGRTLYIPGKKSTGTYVWQETDLEKVISASKGLSTAEVLSLGAVRVVLDPVRKTETLYCFGAGHVALPAAHMAALVGFRVVVIDDRDEFANRDRFPEADEVRVIEDFNHALDGLPIDADSYIVIVTRGHAFDRVVLEQALKTKAGYIGMISSRKKREQIYSALMEEGVSKEALAFVHSPIGIPIGGDTPEEIAVSIVAELIGERYKRKS
ncbi:MAG: XdhC family protein [Deltaproteobacteria bacterium]|nr:XdhC family protein [Deltaproteobacteria bacterium]